MFWGVILKILVDLGISLLTAILVMSYFDIFFEMKPRKYIKYIIYILFILWQLATEYIIKDIPFKINILLCVLFVFFTSCFYKGKIFGKSAVAVFYVVTWVLAEALTGAVFLIFDIDIGTYAIIGSFVSKFLLLGFVKSLNLFYKKAMLYDLPWYINLLIMLLPLSSMYLVYCMYIAEYQLDQKNFKQPTVIAFLIILIINIVVFGLFIQISENLELKYKSILYEKELNLLDHNRKEREDVVLEIRQKKHDIKHQMMELLDLLHNQQYTMLENRIMKIADVDSFGELRIANTDNSLIDSFVNYKYEIALHNGISFRAKIDIPDTLPFENSDLCIILGNAFDNAIEACMRGYVENPYIELSMIYDVNNLIIVIDNSFDGELKSNFNGDIISRKQDAGNHGIGIKSIKKVLKKYHGYYSVEADKSNYCLKIIMYGING